jgi:FkbM family methyltransferase
MNIGGDADDPETSGETWVLRHMLGPRPVIVDGGAQVGRYARAALRICDKPQIHCVEPSSIKVESLRRLEPQVTVHHVALGAERGHADLFGRGPAIGDSLYERKGMDVDYRAVETVEVMTLDELARSFFIERIDLLKLDVEGHELEVLRGATELLAAEVVRAIQFEFGRPAIDSRTFFRDFWYLLHDDFAIHRILPSGLRSISSYSDWMEQFSTANFLAVRRKAKADT